LLENLKEKCFGPVLISCKSMPVRLLAMHRGLLNSFQFSTKNNNGTVLESLAIVTQNIPVKQGIKRNYKSKS